MDADAKRSKWFMFSPFIFLVFDWMFIFLITKLDASNSKFNFFEGNNAWRLPVLGLPLALMGVVSGIYAIKGAKGILKAIPIIGIILCLAITYLFYLNILSANGPNFIGLNIR